MRWRRFLLVPALARLANCQHSFWEVVRRAAIGQFEAGDFAGVLSTLQAGEAELGPLVSGDDGTPSLFFYAGLALHKLGETDASIKAFNASSKHRPMHLPSYLNLGDLLLGRGQFKEAGGAFSQALQLNLTADFSKLRKAKSWMADWESIEEMTEQLRAELRLRQVAGLPPGVSAADFQDCDAGLLRRSAEHMMQSQPIKGFAGDGFPTERPQKRERLRVGFLSSDFGVHPVSQLVHGVVQLLSSETNKSNAESTHNNNNTSTLSAQNNSNTSSPSVDLYLISLASGGSWWRDSMAAAVGKARMIDVAGAGPALAAEKVAALRLHVLVDLNGHTAGGGLGSVLARRVAPLQLTWLGLPQTTGAPFVDFLVGDKVAVPVTEAAVAFTEKMLLLPGCYMPNDHAQLLGHAVSRPRATARDVPGLEAAENAFRFASFSNFGKMSPLAWTTWMHVLRRAPAVPAAKPYFNTPYAECNNCSVNDSETATRCCASLDGDTCDDRNELNTVPLAATERGAKLTPKTSPTKTLLLRPTLLWLQRYRGWTSALPHLREEAAARGVNPARLVDTKLQPWIEHVWGKTVADLALDTVVKSGHTTAADGLWAGVPLLAVGGAVMERRAGASMLAAMGLEFLALHSVKEMEDTAVRLASNPRLLSQLRARFESQRLQSDLFDTTHWANGFVRGLQAAVEVKIACQAAREGGNHERFLQHFSGSGNASNGLEAITACMHVVVPTAREQSSESGFGAAKIYPQRRLVPTSAVLPDGTIAKIGSDILSSSVDARAERGALKAASVDIIEPENRLELQVLAAAADSGAGGEAPADISNVVQGQQIEATLWQQQQSSHRAAAIAAALEKTERKAVLREPILLHIGGLRRRDGWTVVNVAKGPETDIWGTMDDLSEISSDSVTAIYCSHALEHQPYSAALGGSSVAKTLREWHRALKHGGALFVSVPDLEVLSRLFLEASDDPAGRHFIVRMIYGGQTDAHDFHFAGFDFGILESALSKAEFCNVRRVENFGLFADTSSAKFKGVPISLNVAAEACGKPGPRISVHLK